MRQKRERLTTQRLVLKPFEESDKPQMLKLLYDAEVSKTFMIPELENVEQAEKLFGKLAEFSRDEEHFEYGIYLDGLCIGFVNDCGIEDTEIEIGYVILPAYQGKGYASEAVSACISELFDMGYARVTAGHFVENPASRRVMEKCGMHPIDFEEDIPYRGAVHHCLYMAIDCPEP